MRRDPTVQVRLIDLLSSGIPDADRSLSRLSRLLGISKGSLEYHIRQLRHCGEVERDSDGVLRVLNNSRQLALGLHFNPNNVVELSAARAKRQLAESAQGYCDVLVHVRVPATRSAADIAETLESSIGAKDVRVFIETSENQPAKVAGVER